MKFNAAKSKLASGILGTVAILCISGCAVPQSTARMPGRDIADLQIDCSRKTEQLQFLESLRSSSDDRLLEYANDFLRFWEPYTRPHSVQQRREVYTGRNDWLINQKIMRLKWDCGPGQQQQ